MVMLIRRYKRKILADDDFKEQSYSIARARLGSQR